jgi:hypothetical protein
MRRVNQFLAVALLVAVLHLSAPAGRAQVYSGTYYTPGVVYTPPYTTTTVVRTYYPTLTYPSYFGTYYAGVGYTTSFYAGYTSPGYLYSPGYVGYPGYRTLNPTVQIGMPGYLLPNYSYYRGYRYAWR